MVERTIASVFIETTSYTLEQVEEHVAKPVSMTQTAGRYNGGGGGGTAKVRAIK